MAQWRQAGGVTIPCHDRGHGRHPTRAAPAPVKSWLARVAPSLPLQKWLAAGSK
jgi:hypothetical protein